MRTFVAITRAEGWLAAASALHLAKARIYNLIIEIESPGISRPAAVHIEEKIDAFLKRHDQQPLNTVAETIFPGTEYKLRGINGVYEYPERIYPAIRSASPWGNYAFRLTERTIEKDGKRISRLENLIEKTRRQLATKSPKYAAYELDLGLDAMELPLYDSNLDHWRVIGGQCLSHISVKLGPRPDYRLYMTAVYRYQYYCQKALGNLLGLARLQACIARELNLPIGPLVCHATLGVLEDKSIDDVPWSRSDLAQLLNSCAADTPHGAPA